MGDVRGQANTAPPQRSRPFLHGDRGSSIEATRRSGDRQSFVSAGDVMRQQQLQHTHAQQMPPPSSHSDTASILSALAALPQALGDLRVAVAAAPTPVATNPVGHQPGVSSSSTYQTGGLLQHAYEPTSALIKRAQPSLKKVLNEFAKHQKAVLKAYATHCELEEKYSTLQRDNLLLKNLADESKKGRQWPSFYLQNAKPVVGLSIDDAFLTRQQLDNSLVYKVDEAFLRLKEQHAREQQEFIFTHHKRLMVLLRAQCDN